MKIDVDVDVSLTEQQKRLLRESCNLHHLGDKEANKWDDERKCFVAKYPDKETPELKEAHWQINAGRKIGLTLTFDEVTGKLVDWERQNEDS